MSYAPVELIVVKFPGNQFKGEIVPALRELTDNGTIRIIDILLINKDEAGDVKTTEINELDEDDYTLFDPLIAEIAGLLTDEDARQLANALEPNSSAGLMLFENTWASRFVEAVRNANGKVVVNERVPQAVMEQIVAAQAETA